MVDRFGDAFANISRSQVGPESHFMHQFEIIKREFGYANKRKTNKLHLDLPVLNPNPEHFDKASKKVLITKYVFTFQIPVTLHDLLNLAQ